MKFAIVKFPGSNCDYDVYYVTSTIFGYSTDMLWHNSEIDLSSYDCIVLPGGFSYGDYLRSGAIARFSPIMNSVIRYAKKGGLVLGICNGFQILLEAGLLPGAMRKNNTLKFVCKYANIEIVNNHTPFTNQCKKKEILRMPIAHGEGNYYIDENGLNDLVKNNQIVLKYKNDNPNGSILNIAGICNKESNIFGLMPHPERCAENILGNGSEDGKKIFTSIIEYIKEKKHGGK